MTDNKLIDWLFTATWWVLMIVVMFIYRYMARVRESRYGG